MKTYRIDLTLVNEAATNDSKNLVIWLSKSQANRTITDEQMEAITGNEDNEFSTAIQAEDAARKIIINLPAIIDVDDRDLMGRLVNKDGGVAITIIATDPDARGLIYGESKEEELGGWFVYRRDIPARGTISEPKTYRIIDEW